MSQHFRCIICNKVNNSAVETEPGDFLGSNVSTYTEDYKHKDAFICYQCDDVIQDCLYEYHIYDMEKELKDE